MSRPLNKIPANKRTSVATVYVRGVECSVVYFTQGAYLSATDTDAAERPTVYVVSVEANGDVTNWISNGTPDENEIAEAVEDDLALPAYSEDWLRVPQAGGL